MTLTIVDLSHVKTVTSWSTTVDGFLLKATQGTGFVDSSYAPRLAQLRAAGRLRGSYHFAGNQLADGQSHPADPVAEADYYLAHCDHQAGELLVLDWEPTAPPADPDSWCAAFHQRVIDRTGVVPLQYMNDGTARSVPWTKTRALLGSSRLWVARYFTNDGKLPTSRPSVGSWGSWLGWQYTSNGSVPGVAGPVDVSTFALTADQWRAAATPGGTVATQIDMNAFLNSPAYYPGGQPGPTISEVLMHLDQFVQPVQRGSEGLVPLRQEIADAKTAALAVQAALGGLTPEAIAAAIGQLPVAEAQQIASLVLAGIAAKMNTPVAG